MHIKSFEITNYKSFLASGLVELSAGFNVIVGQNNVGKTAFAEAMSLSFDDRPHRSPRTAPTPNTLLGGTSRVRVEIELSREGLINVIADRFHAFPVQFTASDDADAEAQRCPAGADTSRSGATLAALVAADQG
jgi:recombinational DNA repair ATPase RecF